MVSYINRMVLGSAQLGLPYGIGNRSGMPSRKEALNILGIAWNAGIRYFDTAPGYHSESLIGEFVKAEGLQKEIRILTKIPTLREDSHWKDFINTTLHTSFGKVGSNHIEVLFFHNPKDPLLLLAEQDFFKELLRNNPVRSLGVSVYEPTEIERLRNSGIELAFQFPFNLLDRRFEKNTIPIGKRFARSIFLQGLLASDSLIDKAPEELKGLHSLMQEECVSNKISLLQMAFSFVVRSDCFDFFLVGVETSHQLEQLLSLHLQLNDHFYHMADRWRSLIDGKWLDPRRWN
jgi:aryl-alcohol dehydrogenase-like predicted oxidoreductase